MPLSETPEGADTRTATQDSNSLDFNSLLETSKLLNSSLELDFILSHIIRTVMGKFLLRRAAILIVAPAASVGEPASYLLALGRGLATASSSPPTSILNPERFALDFQLPLLVPITTAKRSVGYLCLGGKPTAQPFSDSERTFIESLASLAASSIENTLVFRELQSLNRQLDQKVQQLNTLFDLAKKYNVASSRSEILKTLTQSISGQMLIGTYLLCFHQTGGAAISTVMAATIEVSKGIKPELFSNEVSHTALQSELETLFTFSVPAHLTAEQFPVLFAHKLRLAVPMRVGETTCGLFICGERLTKIPFTASDLEFLFSAASAAMSAVEQARLFAETLEKQALEKELGLAREIQLGLLPTNLPEFEGIELAATNIPSKHIGGDYYDIIQLDATHIFVAIADVTGKGVPASLLMSNLQASIKSFLLNYTPEGFDFAGMIGKINTVIYENTPSDKFITFFGGILDMEAKTFHSVNAGHNPPYLVGCDGEMRTLNAGGVILGIIPTLMPYESETTALTAGDTLFLFTDGVTEAMNKAREEFGEARVEEILKAGVKLHAMQILNEVISAVSHHEPAGEQHDDITALCIKIEPC